MSLSGKDSLEENELIYQPNYSQVLTDKKTILPLWSGPSVNGMKTSVGSNTAFKILVMTRNTKKLNVV